MAPEPEPISYYEIERKISVQSTGVGSLQPSGLQTILSDKTKVHFFKKMNSLY